MQEHDLQLLDSSLSQDEILNSLPMHLRPFVRKQHHRSYYNARDHAAWRFLMGALHRSLSDSAHPVYLEGLAETGIALDHIPSIDEMNACLAKIGWRAVVVDGFIPPAIFMEFQALRVLVIARDMRSVEHLLYTPAPDILHESAGHAPFIVDVDYAEFLQRFGEVGMRAIADRHDVALYEAIRSLSILKEDPESDAAEVEKAEKKLEELAEEKVEPSEAALLTRLHWWTVEYGLVGELDNYRIFGAGLLSSLGESQTCLDDRRVKKLPLTVNAVRTPYDITRTQPQLFVTRSCKHLCQVLEEFSRSMAYRRGGAEGLTRALKSMTVCTAEYDSGVQVSGIIESMLCDAVGNVVYLRAAGPTQLSWNHRELYGHGISAHPQGFGSPVGLIKDFSRCLSEYTIDELKAHDIRIGEAVVLEFLSGISVAGRLQSILRQEHRNLLLSFIDCRVTDADGTVLFEPDWGQYDMAVGGEIVSVFGGVADRERFPLYEALPQTRRAQQDAEPGVVALYERLQSLECYPELPGDAEVTMLSRGLDDYPDEWLLRAEILRAARSLPQLSTLRSRAVSELRTQVRDAQRLGALALLFPDDFPDARLSSTA